MNRKLIAIITLSFLLLAFLSSAAFWVWLQAQYASGPARSSAGSSMANAQGSAAPGSMGGRSADMESTEPSEPVEPSFYFFPKVDRKLLADNLAQLNAKFEQRPRPAGMEDDVYAMCDALLNDDTSMKQLCHLTKDKTGEVVDAGFTKDGEYFVTLGDKLIVWRAATGEKVREHAVPLAGAKTLLLQKDPSMAVLVNDTTLLKCSLVDGKVDGKREYKVGIKHAAMAYETGSIAICNGEMYAEYISSDLTESRVFAEAQLAAPQLAIAPNDRCIVFIHKQQPIRWLLKEKTSEILKSHEIEVPKYTLVSGDKQDYMVSDGGMYGFREGQNIMPAPGREYPIAFHLILPIYQALPLNSGHMDTLLMVLGARPGEKPGLRVVDYHFTLASKPVRICDGEDAKVFTNRFGNRLAVQDSAGIQLYHRRTWVSADGNMWHAHMLELFRNKRFKQIELAADYVRSHKRLPCNITGERAYSDLVGGIGAIWAGWDETKDNPECLKLYELAEQWKAGKSTLALCASAARHTNIGSRARGTGFANTVSEEQWETFGQRNQKALEDLSSIVGDADLPASSFELTMFILQNEGGSHQAADRILEVYTVSHPYETLCHEIAALWSLERWGGARGQGNAYFERLAELYPSEWSDIVYGRLASRFKLDVAELEPGEFCLNQSRAVNGLAAMLKLDWVPRDEMEQAIAYYNLAGAGDISSFVDRHRAEYDVMGPMAYHHNVQHLFVPKQ